MIHRIISSIKNSIWRRRLGRAVDEANRWREKTGYRYMVLNIGGRLVVTAKKDIKQLIARRRMFRKGVTVQQIERSALYITPAGGKVVESKTA